MWHQRTTKYDRQFLIDCKRVRRKIMLINKTRLSAIFHSKWRRHRFGHLVDDSARNYKHLVLALRWRMTFTIGVTWLLQS